MLANKIIHIISPPYLRIGSAILEASCAGRVQNLTGTNALLLVASNQLKLRTASQISARLIQSTSYKKHLRAIPRELYAVERLHLKPLPAWIPEVYRVHQRLVDIEGYVALNSNRFGLEGSGSLRTAG